jgi:site-specific recombinase XerD
MKKLILQTSHYEYLLQSYTEWLQTIGYADPTIEKWPVHVRELLHYLERKNILHLTLVNNRHIQDFLQHINHRSNTARPGALSSSSINTIINGINNFAGYLNSTGKYMLDFTTERAIDNIPVPAVLTISEVKALYEATFLPQRENTLAMGQRDRAMIAVFYGCGLRRMEGIQLNCSDMDLGKKLVFVRKGKGNKQRHVPIAIKHAADIRSYLEEGRDWFLYEHYGGQYTHKYAKRKEAPDEGAFFVGQHGKRMKDFYQRLSYLKEQTGIEKQFGLHTLRHSIATHLAISGMSIEEIARFLGHSTLDSTQIYVHLAHELKNNENGKV